MISIRLVNIPESISRLGLISGDVVNAHIYDGEPLDDDENLMYFLWGDQVIYVYPENYSIISFDNIPVW